MSRLALEIKQLRSKTSAASKATLAQTRQKMAPRWHQSHQTLMAAKARRKQED